MRHLNSKLTHWTFLAVAAMALAGCRIVRTIEHRSVQDEFVAAVRADANPNFAAFGLENPYQPVLDRLTDEAIAELNPTLLPNAYMMRAVAAWRSGDLDLARTSARTGRQLDPPAQPGTREDVVFHLLPALIFDSEATAKWVANDKVTDPTEYFGPEDRTDEGMRAGYMEAMAILHDTIERFDSSVTPQGLRDYVYFQGWRVVGNWQRLITDIGEREARKRAQQEAQNHAVDRFRGLAGEDQDLAGEDETLAGVAQWFSGRISEESGLAALTLAGP